jgi:hypothetical protein
MKCDNCKEVIQSSVNWVGVFFNGQFVYIIKGLTTHYKKPAWYEMSYRVSKLDGFFGTT